MVSDFIEEHGGYLQLTENEYQEAVKSKPSIKQQARAFLEYGTNKEGYWTSEKFMAQIKEAATIAESKYHREKGYRLVWIFDHSSCQLSSGSTASSSRPRGAKIRRLE